MLVGRKDHDDVGPCGGFSIAEHLEAGVFSLFGGRGTGAQGDGDFCHAGIAQVLGVGMALTAIADNGDFIALDQADVSEIGRASCRERVCQYVLISVVAVSLKKKSSTISFLTYSALHNLHTLHFWCISLFLSILFNQHSHFLIYALSYFQHLLYLQHIYYSSSLYLFSWYMHLQFFTI